MYLVREDFTKKNTEKSGDLPNLPRPIQLPRVIEWGVGVNDSREFELLIGCHWHIGGGGMLIG